MGVRQASQNEEIALRELWVSVEGRSGCRGISSKDVLHLVMLLGLLVQSPIIVIEGRKWGGICVDLATNLELSSLLLSDHLFCLSLLSHSTVETIQ